jgi:hypothetical protein
MSNIDINSNQNLNQGSTPYKYNGGQVYNSDNLCISVDWFQVMLNGIIEGIDIEDLQDDYQFNDVALVVSEKHRNGTTHFKVGYEVLHHGERFGLLLLFPRSKVLDESASSFQVYNNLLYQKGWTVRFIEILKQLDLALNNVTRLDLAIDGADIFSDWKKYEIGEYNISGKATTKVYRNSNRSIKQFELGSKSSDKMIVGYNKSKELLSGKSVNKNYIKNHWEKFNIDTSKDVLRLELRLRNKAIKLVKEFSIQYLENAEYIAGLMRSQMENFFEYRKANDNDKNKRRAPKIQPLDWDKLKYKSVNMQKTTKKANSVWAAQRYLTFGLRELHSSLPEEKIMQNEKWVELSDTAIEYGLQEWWKRLNDIIAKRDKAIIMEMKYKSKEFKASGKTFADYTKK